MQPLLTQVPPNRLRSIIATFIPVSASRTARDGPAWPVPITIASHLVAIGIPPLGLRSSTIFRVPTSRYELLAHFARANSRSSRFIGTRTFLENNKRVRLLRAKDQGKV